MLPVSLQPAAGRQETSPLICDSTNACCLETEPSPSRYETVKPKPDFLKEAAVKAAHILVGGPLFGCANSENSAAKDVDVTVDTAVTDKNGVAEFGQDKDKAMETTVMIFLAPPNAEEIRSVEYLLDGFFCRKDGCNFKEDPGKNPLEYVIDKMDNFMAELFICPTDSPCPQEESVEKYLRYLDSLDDQSAVEIMRAHLLFSRHTCGEPDKEFYIQGCMELEEKLEHRLAERGTKKAFLTLVEYYRKNTWKNSSTLAEFLEKRDNFVYQALSQVLDEAVKTQTKAHGKEKDDFSGRSEEVIDLLLKVDQERLIEEMIRGRYGDEGREIFLRKIEPAEPRNWWPGWHITLREGQLWKMYENTKTTSLKRRLVEYFIPYSDRTSKELPLLYPRTNADEAESLINYLLGKIWHDRKEEGRRCYGDCPHDENYSLFKRLYEVARTKEQKCAVVMRLNALWNENEEEREKWCGTGN